jgi:hypothetical protein
MRRQKGILLISMLAVFTVVAAASTFDIVKWGQAGGDLQILTVDGNLRGQNPFPAVYNPATLVNPADGINGYDVNAFGRTNEFSGAFSNTNTTPVFVGNAAGDYMQLVYNGDFTVTPFETMVAWDSSQFLAQGSSQLEELTVEFRERSTSNVPTVSFVVETSAGWYVTDQIDSMNGSTYKSFILDAASATFSGFNKFGVTAGSGQPDLSDLQSVGVFSSTTGTVIGWTGTFVRYINVVASGDIDPSLFTSNGTPKSWLDLYGLVVGGDYEAADLLDSDADGRLNWEEYQDGTDPTGVVMAEISVTLVEGTGGAPDTLSFAPPNTKWIIEASADDVEWGVLPDSDVEFITEEDGVITASVSSAALAAGGTYRVFEPKKNNELIIFLTEGQSNMVGWTAKTQGYYEMDDYPLPNMYQLSRGKARLEYDPGAADTIVRAFQPLQTTYDRSLAATSYFVSLDFYFAREYAKAHPNQDVLIVKNAKGGSGFVNNFWNEGNTCDVLTYPSIAAALNQVSSDYTTIRFGGILWHQGEADAVETGYATYAQNLTALVVRHRGFVESQITASDAPFILGTMIPGAIIDNTTGYYDDIDAIHRDIANLVDNAGCADLSSITGRAGLHFLADGYQTAGEIYYQKWLQVATAMEWIIPGDFIAPTGVDFADFAVFAAAWQNDAGEPNWNVSCNLAEPDDVIDMADLAVFCENWLAGKM